MALESFPETGRPIGGMVCEIHLRSEEPGSFSPLITPACGPRAGDLFLPSELHACRGVLPPLLRAPLAARSWYLMGHSEQGRACL